MTYIVLVNWNGWRDTIECLESVFRLRDCDFRVVVVDNGSEDDSVARIEAWAAGNQGVEVDDPAMAGFSSPPIDKPVPFCRLDRVQAQAGGPGGEASLILIEARENLGFAGGNNVGLSYALRQPEMRQAWLLNNDTVVDPGALSALVGKLDRKPQAGLVGSTLAFYHHPDKVQAFGGAIYLRCIGLAVHLGRFRSKRRLVDERAIEKRMDYVVGASMLVSRAFLETVGLMCEDYFLYYEEIDWAHRGRKQFELGYARESLVFHKAGKTIGSSRKISVRSLKSDTYLMSNRLKVTDRYFPRCRVTVKAFLLVEALVRVVLGRREHARMILALLRDPRASGVQGDTL